MLPAIDITTERLRLRQVVADDLPDLLLVNGDPEVTAFLPYATWQSLADAQAWLGRMQALEQAGTARQLVLHRRDDARVVGTALLFKWDAGSARVELGYALGRSCWGQGLMREALVALLGHGFAQAGFRRVEAEVNPDNRASTRLLLGLGFQTEGRARERWVTKGVTHDTSLFGLLASDWPAAPA